MKLPRIFCLVGSADDLSLLPQLVEVGIDGFQVRDKTASGRELVDLTRTVLEAARPAGAMVVVNDRLDVALATGADGVHLGKEDLPVGPATRAAPGLVVGATCRDPADVARAASAGASYAGFGPAYATTSKSGLPEPQGPAGVARAAGRLPLIAISGVTPQNAAALIEAGAHGVAVLGAIWRSPDPVEAARNLVRTVGR